ncbi:MAG: GGDEF domain-containing protein [Flexilinea sp.]|nr:GGDEF domain-containing protein [Flexilinea sp.]
MIRTGTISRYIRTMPAALMNINKNLNPEIPEKTTEKEPAASRTGKEGQNISANALVMPIVVVLAILHVLIVILILGINSSSSVLSSTMKDAGLYTQEATSILSGSSLLSETASNFVLMPLTETGEVNVSPLAAYAQELVQDRRGDQVLARFRNYGVSQEVYNMLEAAADNANFMLDAQLHAISLVSSIYPLPDIAPLNFIPHVELTEEEMNMTDQQKLSAARTMILGSVYALNKQSVSQNVNAAVGLIQGSSAARAAAASEKVAKMRTSLWTVTLAIIVILIITFTMLYSKILIPLKKFTEQIPTGDFLDENKGFLEVNMLASAYNDVLKRRNSLDNILRSAAETDALTNLPNRYSFEQYMLESADNNNNMPIAVFLFDVNYLKRTNDTLGHLAGDQLICRAAECISNCFGEKCFRFGGDEFAAIVEDCTPQSINEMVYEFRQSEKEHDVSISFGYAYTDQIGSISVKELLDEADRKMYTEKRKAHREEQAVSSR